MTILVKRPRIQISQTAGSLHHKVVEASLQEIILHTFSQVAKRNRERHRGPVVMVTQAASGAQQLQHDLPILADFPCCHMTAKLADSRYPPLQWQQRAAKVAVQRAAAQGSWLQVNQCNDRGLRSQQGYQLVAVMM